MSTRPTGAKNPLQSGEFEARLDRLSPEQRKLFERLRNIHGRVESSAPQPEDRFPTSFQQKRLRFLDQLYPDLLAYNVSAALRFTGPLDAGALERSLDLVVRRHAVIRAAFSDDGEWMRIKPATRVSLPVVECASEDEVRRRVREFSRLKFDLKNGPLYRFILLRKGEHRHMFVYCFHHTVFDGASNSVLYRELEAAYGAFRDGLEPRLPVLDEQYADYVLWQRKQRSRKDYQASLQYWRQRFEGETPVLKIHGDWRRPAVTAHEGARLNVDLRTDLVDRLTEYAGRNRCTFFVVLLSAYAVLLHRYTEEEEIVIGSPVSGRLRSGHAALLGYFVNMLPLRIDLRGRPGFGRLLGQVRQVVTDALSHQCVSLDHVISEAGIERDLGGNPLFNALLGYRNFPKEQLNLPGIKARWERVDNGTARFDLSLYITQLPGRTHGQLEYNAELFSDETAQAMANHFVNILEDVAGNPDAQIGDLELLHPEEKRTLLHEWNKTRADYPREHTTTDLLQRAFSAFPRHAALECRGECLSYEELDRASRIMARRLLDAGVRPKQVVAVCLERGTNSVKSLLAVMRAGGVYLPLDPDYPSARLRFILRDSGACAIITDAGGANRLNEFDIPVLLAVAPPAVEQAQFADVSISPQDRAYVIYTSGSTGQPKGVEVPHRALVNFLTNSVWRDTITAADSLLAVTPLVFDVSMMEILLPLTRGATLRFAARPEIEDPDRLSELIANTGVSAMITTPSGWRRLLAGDWSAPGLKAWFAGEAMDEETAARLMDRVGQLWNGYGPTEATILSTMRRVNTPGEVALIGKPIGNTRVYVLDSRLRPVPVGVVGELYIGGDGLAYGYLGKAELTRQRFVPDPFSTARDARMYRTGDMVRYTRDGDLEYICRNDDQVKLRGYRIELGEMEACLNGIDGVRTSVAAIREPVDGDRRLVAYVELEDGTAWNTDYLRKHCRRYLPEYMLPQHFLHIDHMPTGSSGKVDRQVLRGIPLLAGTEDVPGELSATQAERTVYAIWRDVLAVGEFGVTDHIFDLGADSMMIMQMAVRLRESFPVSIEFRWFFDFPTVRELAARIDEANSPRTPQ